jgi:hypothetical protein
MNSQTYTLKNGFWKSGSNTRMLIKVSILCLLLLSSCYASKFTSDNVMKLKIGMTSSEVINIFGKPLKTSATTCGASTSNPWPCIVWFYGDVTPMFIFTQENDGVLYLNSWNM